MGRLQDAWRRGAALMGRLLPLPSPRPGASSQNAESLLLALNMRAIVSVANREGRILEVNDAFCRASGYGREELLGQIHRIVNSDDQPAESWAEMWHVIAQGASWHGNVCNRAKDGSLYWMDAFIAPLEGADGRIDKCISICTNISARKQAAQALKHEPERLDNIIEGANDGTWEWNVVSGALQVNKRFAFILDCTLAELEPITVDIAAKLVHPDDWQRARGLLRAHFKGQSDSFECEIRMRTHTGRWVWVLNRSRVFSRDAGGRPLSIVGMLKDVDARRQTEGRLRESEAFNHSILNSMTAEIAVLDRNGVIVAVNESWRKSGLDTGVTSGTAAPHADIGVDYLSLCQANPDFASGPDALRARTGILAVIGGGVPSFELEYRRDSPTERRWFALGVTPLDSESGGVVVVHSNITARKHAETELQTQNGQLLMHRQVLDAVSEYILVKGADSRIVWANRAFLSFYGMTIEQLHALIDASFVEPDLTLKYVRDDAQVFASGAVLDIPDEAATRFDGQIRHWHTVKSPIFDSSGKVVATVGVARDTTERRQAEATLRASEALLDQTGRLGGVGGWTLDLATRVTVWTDQTCRIYEVEPGHQPTIEEGISYYAPEARPVIAQAVQHSLATGEGFDLELPFVTATGRAIWVRAVGEPEIVDGRAVRLLGAFQDITARRAMETELRRNNNLLGSVLENLPCGLSVYGADLKFLATNAEYRRLLDLPEALFEGNDVGLEDVLRFNAARGDYGTENIDAKVQSYLAQARSQSGDFAAERSRPNGQPLEIHGGPMPGGGFVLTHTDISARKHAEQALQKQTERLRLATESAGIAVWEYDPRRGTVEWDDMCYRMYGISRDDDAAPLALWSKHLHPQDAQRVLAELHAALEGHGRFTPEFRIIRPDGEVRYLQAAAHVVRDAAEQPVRMTGVNLDITLQRLGQDALRDAKLAAEAANVAKSDFLANMSHEIRTPMNAILGMLALLRKSGLPPRQADYALKAHGAARSLLGLLGDILDFSKVEAGKMMLDPQPFRIEQLQRDLSVIVSAYLGDKPLAVRFEIDAALPPMLIGDAMRLQQVLVNLSSNAIKFTAAGEVVVSMAVVAFDAAAVTLEIAVRDTGIGIAPENHARIFSGFTQAEASTTRRFGGTGLGLAISQRLVALMGGKLELDSAPDRGSRFHFCLTLPVAADTGESKSFASAGPAHGIRRLAGMRLLVVEDNANNQQVARELLEDEGAFVQVAQDGQIAVAAVKAAELPFDVVLMDLQMPVMDGYCATRAIRSDLGMRDLPIVAMTANAMATDREACLAAGMNDHVGKPFELNHLVQVLRQQASWAEVDQVVAAAPDPDLPAGIARAAAAAGVDLDTALARLGGKRSIYQRMLRSFVIDLATIPEQLRALVAQGQALAATRLLHTIKGLAASLGDSALAGQAAQAERQLRAALTPEAAASAIDGICVAVNACGPDLTALLNALQVMEEPGPANPVSLDRAAFKAALQALIRQLRQADMAATDSMDALQRQFGAALGTQLQPLDDAVNVLDFERALQLCDELIRSASDTQLA